MGWRRIPHESVGKFTPTGPGVVHVPDGTDAMTVGLLVVEARRMNPLFSQVIVEFSDKRAKP